MYGTANLRSLGLALGESDAGTMLVERAVVNGRIGPTKTETSKDEVPLDGELASILLEWR